MLEFLDQSVVVNFLVRGQSIKSCTDAHSWSYAIDLHNLWHDDEPVVAVGY